MDLTILIGIIFFIILVGAVGTVLIGLNPQEAKYGTATKRNWKRLLLFYGASTVVLMGVFFYAIR